jgi:hypothetical protein
MGEGNVSNELPENKCNLSLHEQPQQHDCLQHNRCVSWPCYSARTRAQVPKRVPTATFALWESEGEGREVCHILSDVCIRFDSALTTILLLLNPSLQSRIDWWHLSTVSEAIYFGPHCSVICNTHSYMFNF